MLVCVLLPFLLPSYSHAGSHPGDGRVQEALLLPSQCTHQLSVQGKDSNVLNTREEGGAKHKASSTGHMLKVGPREAFTYVRRFRGGFMEGKAFELARGHGPAPVWKG